MFNSCLQILYYFEWTISVYVIRPRFLKHPVYVCTKSTLQQTTRHNDKQNEFAVLPTAYISVALLLDAYIFKLDFDIIEGLDYSDSLLDTSSDYYLVSLQDIETAVSAFLFQTDHKLINYMRHKLIWIPLTCFIR